MSNYAGKRSNTHDLEAKTSSSSSSPTVGKQTLVEQVYGQVQRRADTPHADPAQVHAAAARGTGTPSTRLPHADMIQRAFGRHDVSGVQAHTGPDAAASAHAMGAQAYATGNHVVLGDNADLHTVAHEAAHVVQQRAGVQLKGGIGEAGDSHERHADAVADAVVAGRSAEGLLDGMAGGGGGAAAVQRKNLTQHGLDTGLTAAGTGVLVNRTKPGKVYTQVVADAVADRTAAMAKASELAAQIGNRTVGKDWTTDKATFNDDSAATLDPFLYKITVSFGTKDVKDKLTLTYQHAERWTGYVVSIEDTSNKTTSGGVTMFNKFDEGGPPRGTDKYSNVHDQSHTGSTNIAKDSEGDEEHNLDAYTKISGEGARWQCVRKHAGNLQNDTLFFTAHPTDTTKVFAVTFVNLWLNWVGAFTARFDIADADVVKAINGLIVGKGKGSKPGGAPLVGLRTAVAKTELKTKDFNLDTHTSHTAS
jgi:hypothetical protein